MKPQIHVLFTSRLFQQVLAYIGSPKICMHASKYACMRPIHAVQKYACMRPSMHACVQVCKFGSIQRCSAEKKRWAAHLGLSNDVSLRKTNDQHIGGLSNDVSLRKTNVQHIWGLSNDVPQKKNDGQHIWGCPTMFRRKKNDVQHIWGCPTTVSYTHLRAHETDSYLVCRLLLEKKKKKNKNK